MDGMSSRWMVDVASGEDSDFVIAIKAPSNGDGLCVDRGMQ